jgi:hypothetical protein
MKKLVNISKSDIDYVLEIARAIGDPRAKNGNFSKGLRKIIGDHKNASK